MAWYKKPKKQFITLGGYAGTGKTTLISAVRQLIKKEGKSKIAFCAYTGKASQNLRKSLTPILGANDNISTIHGLIYRAIVDPAVAGQAKIIGWERKEVVEADLIVVDEASMINEKIWADLLSYDKPILAVGDHGQLPPIDPSRGGAGGSFNLMEEPELVLSQIHRQAEGNPIIKLSIMAREKGKIPVGEYGDGVRKLSRYKSETGAEVEEMLQRFDDETMILTGYNKTRVQLNKEIRNYLGFESGDPLPGDKVICLKNNWNKGIFNGMTGMINRISAVYDKNMKEKKFYKTLIEMEDGVIYEGKIMANQFNRTDPPSFDRVNYGEASWFDFGYALTVHKAQGGQAKKVLLFEERFPRIDDTEWKKWLYTGITRAMEELVIVGV